MSIPIEVYAREMREDLDCLVQDLSHLLIAADYYVADEEKQAEAQSRWDKHISSALEQAEYFVDKYVERVHPAYRPSAQSD